ncbi:MAG: hypothetical protein HLUCCA12_08620 [Rhodobacteraceae bacterium HLUCCA12]|nr:MAG: hypothetical protein HLUCCA12_08620 [Rhodobacteraceae bacterium HLUCCA12]
MAPGSLHDTRKTRPDLAQKHSTEMTLTQEPSEATKQAKTDPAYFAYRACV